MTSSIDPTVPVAGNPTTESVRQNFAIIKAEIETLQTIVEQALQGPTTVEIWNANGATNITSVTAATLPGGLKDGVYILTTTNAGSCRTTVATGMHRGMEATQIEVPAPMTIKQMVAQLDRGAWKAVVRTFDISTATATAENKPLLRILRIS